MNFSSHILISYIQILAFISFIFPFLYVLSKGHGSNNYLLVVQNKFQQYQNKYWVRSITSWYNLQHNVVNFITNCNQVYLVVHVFCDYLNTLANLTLIILFSKMLKFWKIISSKSKNIVKNNSEYLGTKISKLINYSMDMCWNGQSTMVV